MTTATTTVERGTMGTYSIGSDAYPAVVTHASASGKTIHVRTVRGIHTKDTHVGPGHDSVEVIADPESVERVLALPPTDATYEEVEYEGETHQIPHANAPMKFMLKPNGQYRGRKGIGRFTPGEVRSKRDPHF